MPDLAHYRLQQLQRDIELVLFRGRLIDSGDANAPSILVRTAIADHPTPASLRRMHEEYSLRSELDPAYVVRPLALIQAGGHSMLVLEDPGGTPLDLLLDGPMEIARFLRLGIRIVAALGHVHSHGLVHKDVKPANILVNAALDQALLMGLGIASRVPRERQSLQPPEFVAGSLAYMAPEQTGRMNRSIDSRSDLYALGVTLYEMLTGSLPFTATDPMEWVHCHIARQPVPPSERLKGIPGPVSAMVMKLLAKMAEERYQTAAGLESDLRRCLAEWETEQRIEEFPLGEHDTPDRLLVPERLYGREAEIAVLLAAFDRVIKGGTLELVLVAGYSGIGKSSVVNELHKVLVPSRGLFASGKFDQYKRDIPYSTLAEAFQSLTRRLLAKSEADLATWRAALLEALGPNGRLMIDLVPELKLIIGDQPPVPDLLPQDVRRRFQLVFRRFIGVFARPEHPLALFLDDLQWLDAATLDLLEDLLTPAGVQHLMLIGAYRDNEVTAAHPLMRKLEAIRSAGANVQQITLAPLAGEDLRQLIADALRCEPERAAPLARLVQEKTAGNPFFVIQFLHALAEEGWLTFDHDKGRWSWDLHRILAKRYRDNVVDLMVGRLNRLPLDTQKALQHLACLGNTAPVRMLSFALGKSPEEVRADLWDAVRLELVEQLEGSYKFVHDRVQEAAYSLIPEELRDAAHLRIGRQLAAHIPPEKREAAIFDIVNQYNRGVALITSRDERQQLAELNLLAGKRAKASTAYASALRYLVAGAALLPGDSWERRHELIFGLELHRAECEFLTGALAVSEERLKLLAVHAANTVERATITRLRLNVYTTLDQSERAVEVCLDYLAHLGVDWLPHPTRAQALGEYERIWSSLNGRSIEDLIELPLMSDPAMLGTLDVLTEVVTPALFTDGNLLSLVICRMVNLSLEHGNSDGSCFAYVFLGMIAGRHFDNYEAGFHFGRIGYELVERHGLRRYQARTYMCFGNLVMPWTKHVRTGRDLVRRAFDAASKAGDLTFAAYSRNNLNTNLLAAGDPLAEAQREAKQGLDFAQNARFGLVIDIITAQLGLIRTLRGLTPTFGCFDDEQFDERRFEIHLASQPDLALPECWYWIRKLQARVLAGDYRQAIEASLQAQRLLWTSPSFFETAEFEFYSGLARAALCDGAVHEQYRQDFEALTAHRSKLEVWAANCPENFENRAALLAAEVARIEGREIEAMRLYEKAVRSARANGFLHNEALANELAARFYATRGFEQIAQLYLRNARHGYLRWGADAKVRELDETYPYLQEGRERVPTASGMISAPVEHLDLATVLNVSQAVSGEIVLEKLVETLLRTAIEHAGAQRGVLILPRGSELLIQAEAKIRGSSVTVRVHETPVSVLELPESIVRYAARTQEPVILDDASARNPFSADEYIREQRPRSVLCLPLVKQGVLVAVLYLENNLGPNFFAPGRIGVLKVLASQAAISLDNSRLYRELTDSETKFRRLVDSNIVGIDIWDFDGRVLEANDAFLRILGYERDDLVSGRVRWADFAPSQALEHDREGLVAQLHSGASVPPLEWEFIHKDGSRVPVFVGAAALEGTSQGIGFALDLTVRKRVEQALRQSEAYLAETQRLTHTGSWAYNPVSGKPTYCSDEHLRIYGLDPGRGRLPELEEIVSRFYPDDRQRMLDLLEQVVREKRGYAADYRIVLPNGRVKHLHSMGHPLLDERGELLEFMGTTVDVTERTRVEQRLLARNKITHILSAASSLEEAAQEILKTFCDSLGWHVGVWWRVDRDAGVLRCGDFWRRRSMETPQFEAATREGTFASGSGLAGNVWGTATPQYISDVARDPHFDRAEVAAREGLHGAFAFPIVLGSTVLGVCEFISRDVWQGDEDLLGLMASVGRQIGQFTERAAAVNELQLRVNMLHHIPVAAWSVAPDGTPDIVNQLWFEYTGQTPQYVNSHPDAWMATMHPEDRERASQLYWEGIRSGHGFTMEARFRRASDGTYRWHLNRAVAVRDADGNILRFVGTSTDVHDFRQVQEELRNTQAEFARITRVTTMGELTASIAHEVNQPLGAMVTSAASCARWLAATPPQMDKARRALDRIANDGRRAGAIIQRIRALMKRQAPRNDWLDVNETILEVIALTQYELRRNDIVLETRLTEGLPRVQGDRVQCQQVLLNLIVNAIEAMSEIGQRRRELTIVTAPDRPDTVRLEVRDSGTGLNPERAAQLFEPFYTTKSQGFGIGLSISRSIIEAHGGRLSAGPNAPHGAVFCIWLPVEGQMP
ncbi:MAG: histidine kinase [Gammaproteobacteria bacterium]|nr:histidine kinase [Gammaproteobacteria bacterium]